MMRRQPSDNVDHSLYYGPALNKRDCIGCGDCSPVGGVMDQAKDNAWAIAGGAAVLFLGIALVRMRKK